MFERFTERARSIVTLAQQEAVGFKHNYIGTEHILLGLITADEGLAARVLDYLDVEAETVREKVAQIVGTGDLAPTGQIPFTPRAKKVFELALREALSLGHNYIGTEHLLLGLVRENEGVAARILLDFDVTATTVRNEVIRMLSGPGRQQRVSAPTDRSIKEEVEGPLVGAITDLRKVKESLIEAQSFDLAAQLRNVERKLVIHSRDDNERMEDALNIATTTVASAAVADVHHQMFADVRQALRMNEKGAQGQVWTWEDALELVKGDYEQNAELEAAIAASIRLLQKGATQAALDSLTNAMGWDRHMIKPKCNGGCRPDHCEGGCEWGDGEPVTEAVRQDSFDATVKLLRDIDASATPVSPDAQRWNMEAWNQPSAAESPELAAYAEVFIDGPGSLQGKADLLTTLTKHVLAELQKEHSNANRTNQ